MTMGWCSNCEECPIYRDPDYRYVCCTLCGRILDQKIYYSRLTFAKDSSGQNRRETGNIIKILKYEFSASYLRTLKKGRDAITYIVNAMHINGDTIIDNAHAFYEMVLDEKFTKGRKISHVAAACLYLSCRQLKLSYLLFDFSEDLQINIYVLGAMFFQLCKTLKLLEHPIVQKIVDPSLFIHRFTKRLLGKNNDTVSEMALRLVAMIGRNWIQTVRKPNGFCGAALYISVHSHGLNYSKSDIVSAVRICEATLNRWLIEFENTGICRLINKGSCDVNMTPYVGYVEGKVSKEPGSTDFAGHESIDPLTFSEQHGFADSEDDESYHFSFSDIDDDEERKQRLVDEAKDMTHAQIPLDATCQILKRKTFSSKINYEALETLFANEQDTAKKQKVESDVGDPHETLNKDDHVDDLDNKDGDEPRASENDNYDGCYADDKGDRDEDFDCEDEDEDYDYGDEDYDYGYEDDF
ncbi:transcription factor IIIB 90 kDa subunit-like isoform X1 [Zingiber officinale]|uniref:transcription factor IIIB 90 kDa subunit-like isoform X1 n=1 Tax=Zingiber officinale TaxID=94328 RepID=UPI001C4AF86C|nr:transcription factor IIIB 90 kDa subunit-like isoform X1 [Zingiber officinale]